MDSVVGGKQYGTVTALVHASALQYISLHRHLCGPVVVSAGGDWEHQPLPPVTSNYNSSTNFWLSLHLDDHFSTVGQGQKSSFIM